MTPALRTARTLTAAAITTTISGPALAYHLDSAWWSIPGLYVGALLAWCAHREYAHHPKVWFRAVIAERAARGEPIGPAVFDVIPCCDLSTHGDHTLHGADCLRPAARPTELDNACCTEGFVSRGTHHDAACPTRTTRSNAA